MKWLLRKRILKGFSRYVFLLIISPNVIREIEEETSALRNLDRDIHTLTERLKGLVMFNRNIDRRLFQDPNLVSLAECQEAGENQAEIQTIEQAINLLCKKRFEQLLFALG